MRECILVGIDVGGTFTDFVIWRHGSLRIHKAPTTPADQSLAIVQGLRELGLLAGTGQAAEEGVHNSESTSHTSHLSIAHGMTVATNALLERRGAATALLTTAGFRDVLVIGRQNRPFLYRLGQQRPPSLVLDERRLEIVERLDANGNPLRPLDEAAFPELAAWLQATGTESLAIVFLFSFRNPAHERRAAQLIHALLPDLPISLSSEILPEYREYERTATTVINAYVQPLVARYLDRLEQALSPRDEREAQFAPRPLPSSTSIRIMQSNGGVIGLHQAAEQAARVVLSGPAGGVVGAFGVAKQALRSQSPNPSIAGNEKSGGLSYREINVLTFDMGGTSTDVCLCPGRIPASAESTITGLPLRLPVIDIHTVGAGGGSIAFVDKGGALQVGPQSAGAVPGPACYGRGGVKATVTDANLVLGRLDPQGFLGGSGQIPLDAAAAHRVLSELGASLGLSTTAAASGVVRVANATMERALRTVSVERGYDPRDFVLLPFGGAGPLHACDLASSLGVRRILCPPIPGVLSAYGMLVADLSNDASQSVLNSVLHLQQDLRPLQEALAVLSEKVQVAMAREQGGEIVLSAELEMRYRGQSYELAVPLALPLDQAGLVLATEAFHSAHAQRYGYALREEAMEVVTLRVGATSPGAQLDLPRRPLQGENPSAARVADRQVFFTPEAPVTAACFWRDRLMPGNRFAGPAIVFQYDSTVVVAPGWSAFVDEMGNLILDFRILAT